MVSLTKESINALVGEVDALRFVMDHEQLTFIEAIKLLGKKYNIGLIEEAQSPEQVHEQKMHVALDWAKIYSSQYLVKRLMERLRENTSSLRA